MTEELFEVPESLSPRLKWMRNHEVRTRFAEHLQLPWCAWTDNDDDWDQPGGMLNDPEACGLGTTEIEAVEDLARALGVVNWEDPK
jgi:hypothetical protein